MDFKIASATSPLAPLTGTQLPQRLNAPSLGAKPVDGGFSNALNSALRSVSAAQENAGEMQRQVQLENPSVSLEETMVALQKSQIGFQATLHVRNRLVQAYTDVMNMQV